MVKVGPITYWTLVGGIVATSIAGYLRLTLEDKIKPPERNVPVQQVQVDSGAVIETTPLIRPECIEVPTVTQKAMPISKAVQPKPVENNSLVPGYMYHTVRPGESLSRIAPKYDMDISDILLLNPELTNPNMIRAGQKLAVKEILVPFDTILKEKRSANQDGLVNLDAPRGKIITIGNKDIPLENMVDLDLDGEPDAYFKYHVAERKSIVEFIQKYRPNDYLKFIAKFIVESSARHYDKDGKIVTSPAGAVGYAQIMPCVVQDLNLRTGKASDRKLLRYETVNGKKVPYYVGVLEGTHSWEQAKKDPITNIKYAIDYRVKVLEPQFAEYENKETLINLAYNAGIGQVKKAIRKAQEMELNNPTSIDTFRPYLQKGGRTEGYNYVKRINNYLERIRGSEVFPLTNPVVHTPSQDYKRNGCLVKIPANESTGK